MVEVTARTVADLIGIQANTAILYYHTVRLAIQHHLALEANKLFNGEVKLDESYFGDVHKGKRGCGVTGKIFVFGLLKRGERVYTVVVKDIKQTTPVSMITSKIKPDNIVYTTAIKATMPLLSMILHILESTILKSLQTITIISMALRTFGINLNTF